MGSLLRAIAAAVRSWFRIDRGRRKRLAAATDRHDLAATDADQASGTAVARARGSLRIDADGTTSLGRLDEPARLRQGETRPHPGENDGASAGAAARRQAEEAACAAAEAEARRKAEENERARRAGEAEARRQAEEAARAAAEAEAQHRAENERALAAGAEARQQAEDAARAAAEVEAKRKAEEDERARIAAEAEARRQAEQTARAAAEAEAKRKAEEDERVRIAEAEARQQAEDAARAAAEVEAKRNTEEDEHARIAAEAEARRQAEQAARAAAEVEVRRKAERDEQSRVPAEDEGRGQSEADAAPWPQAGDGGPPEAEEEVQPASGEGLTEEGTEPTAPRTPRTRAPRYRGPAGGPPALRQAPARTSAARTESAADGNRVLPVELRVLFERGGSLRVTLLPRRSRGLPEELTVWAPAGTVDLIALQEDWYQDVAPPDLGALLLEGVLWRDEATGQEWLRSGREIFVLTSGTAHRGLVTCPRLVLGREHAVLCTTTRLAAVEGVLREAGCEGWRTLDDNDGAPRGWVLLCDVLPRRPVQWTDNSDILNGLRPLPQVEIALEGGIRLGYASWLAEHPPSIRVYGDPDHTGAVQIDGHNATASADGCYTAPGWDSVGPHQVWCNATTRTFSLVRREPLPQSWAAFSFPTPGARDGRIAICGPLVRAFTDPQADGEEAATSEIIQVGPANPVLLGSVPGQVLVTHPRPDVRGAQCIVSSPFAPVWAIPAQPLRCDKRENRVRLIGEPWPPGEGSGEVTARITRPSIEQWCSAIRDAGRKGLAVEPADPAVTELWRRYRRYARELWRGLR